MAELQFKSLTSLRSGAKVPEVAQWMRRRIFGGDWNPGERIPTNRKLAQTAGVSLVTVQKAADALLREGFIDTAGRRGTFVSDRPPHQSRFAVAYPFGEAELHRFRAADFNPKFRSLLHTYADQHELNLDFYFVIDKAWQSSDAQRLLAEAREHRLAGVIFPWLRREIDDTPLAQLGVPTVGFQHGQRGSICQATLELPIDRHVERAAAYAQAQGRSRMGILLVDTFSQNAISEAIEAARVRGIEVRNEWVMGCSPYQPHWLLGYLRLIGQLPAAQRPDVLLVNDDSFVDAAATGLSQAGLRVPDDMLVIAHANFPLGSSEVKPFVRMGANLTEAVAQAFETLACSRGGDVSPANAELPLHLAHEFSSSSSPARLEVPK